MGAITCVGLIVNVGDVEHLFPKVGRIFEAGGRQVAGQEDDEEPSRYICHIKIIIK